MNSITQLGFGYDAFDTDYTELQQIAENLHRDVMCCIISEQDVQPALNAAEEAAMNEFYAKRNATLNTLRKQWDADARSHGYADYNDYVAQIREQQRRSVAKRADEANTAATKAYPTRNTYQTLTLRERVQRNRQEEARKHVAYVARHNSTATAGIKKLQQAVSKAKQPVQLRLF